MLTYNLHFLYLNFYLSLAQLLKIVNKLKVGYFIYGFKRNKKVDQKPYNFLIRNKKRVQNDES